MSIAFDNSYARLPERMFARVAPTPVSAPALIVRNEALARDLGLDTAALTVGWLAGNSVPPGAEPIAQAYAGHQFGGWNPQLGDGRAVLLGEVVAPDGRRFDIQLKGAGRTPWSRGGDGRAWLGPVLREYLVSEAMAALGVPTTRALAAVTTGDPVYREEVLPGAVLTRVAASHVRVGTFQYFAARGDVEALAMLTDHVIRRHYPGADGPAGLLSAVVAAQARLIARWMGLGFIHGVMNTDNCAVSGETIDYGPCAFMDAYHPATVFSSIDRQGRYAFGNQPQIALWNLAQFATALVPLTGDKAAAVEEFTEIINRFADLYQAEWLAVFGTKLGLVADHPEVQGLAEGLLALMAEGGSDFTNTFAALAGGARDQVADRGRFADWEARWLGARPDRRVMAAANPRVIPRTHLIEAAITAGVGGDFAPFHAMLAAVTQPFALADPAFAVPPDDSNRVLRTFCGT